VILDNFKRLALTDMEMDCQPDSAIHKHILANLSARPRDKKHFAVLRIIVRTENTLANSIVETVRLQEEIPADAVMLELATHNSGVSAYPGQVRTRSTEETVRKLTGGEGIETP
jgi:hypothetical protein